MDATMGESPLALDLLLRRAPLFADKEIVSASPAGLTRLPYGDWYGRVARLGGALRDLGLAEGAAVATLCWSTSEHLELYFGVPCSGRVLHTLNPRFRPEQLALVVAEAGDSAVFVHRSLAAVLDEVLDRAPSIEHLVVIDDGSGEVPPARPGLAVHRYEDLVAAAGPAPTVVADERQAAVVCHTGGTTGDPKGVVYSHRSLVLHAMAVTSAGGIAMQASDVALPVVPLFHANAVGFAHAAVGTGATLVLPGSDLSGGSLARLIEEQQVTVTCGVPTIWSAVLPHLAGRDVPRLRTIISGASAVPPSLSAAYRDQVGLPLTQIWGMTETSPYATIARRDDEFAAKGPEAQAAFEASVGRPVLGVEARLVDDQGDDVAPDGTTAGELLVRGPWVTSGYLAGRAPESFTADGWLRTGDVATMDAHGVIHIVDRIKDVIKSGGEWISSIELELLLMAHPDVAEAAVVAVADERWGERPVAYVVPADPGSPPDDAALTEALAGRVPTWWVPDRFVLIDEIPKTSVGKFSKASLRDGRPT